MRPSSYMLSSLSTCSSDDSNNINSNYYDVNRCQASTSTSTSTSTSKTTKTTKKSPTPSCELILCQRKRVVLCVVGIDNDNENGNGNENVNGNEHHYCHRHVGRHYRCDAKHGSGGNEDDDQHDDDESEYDIDTASTCTVPYHHDVHNVPKVQGDGDHDHDECAKTTNRHESMKRRIVQRRNDGCDDDDDDDDDDMEQMTVVHFEDDARSPPPARNVRDGGGSERERERDHGDINIGGGRCGCDETEDDDDYDDDYDDMHDEESNVVDRIRAMLLQETDGDYARLDYLSPSAARHDEIIRRDRRQRQRTVCPDRRLGRCGGNRRGNDDEDSFSSSDSSDRIDEGCRSRMVQWMYDVANYCKLSRECVQVATSYLDRFMSYPHSDATDRRHDAGCVDVVLNALNNRRSYQLASMTSLYLSVKLMEEIVFTPELMSRVSRGEYDPCEFVAMELHMLKVLGWRVTCPTPMNFARHFVELIMMRLCRDCCGSSGGNGGIRHIRGRKRTEGGNDHGDYNSSSSCYCYSSSVSDHYLMHETEDENDKNDDTSSSSSSQTMLTIRQELERSIQTQIESASACYDLSISRPPSIIAEAAVRNAIHSVCLGRGNGRSTGGGCDNGLRTSSSSSSSLGGAAFSCDAMVFAACLDDIIQNVTAITTTRAPTTTTNTMMMMGMYDDIDIDIDIDIDFDIDGVSKTSAAAATSRRQRQRRRAHVEEVARRLTQMTGTGGIDMSSSSSSSSSVVDSTASIPPTGTKSSSDSDSYSSDSDSYSSRTDCVMDDENDDDENDNEAAIDASESKSKMGTGMSPVCVSSSGVSGSKEGKEGGGSDVTATNAEPGKEGHVKATGK